MAWVLTRATPLGPPPRFLGNLKNFPNFTIIQLDPSANDTPYTRMEFSGPNGEVTMILMTSRLDESRA